MLPPAAVAPGPPVVLISLGAGLLAVSVLTRGIGLPRGAERSEAG